MSWVSQLFAAVANIFGWSKHRSEVKNAPDVKAAAVAKQERAQVDTTAKAVRERDLDQIRKELAE